MALLRLQDVSFSYGGPNLLEEISLEIQAGERIGLVGRNGTGKSTLLKLLEGELKPDNGEIARMPGLRIARLAQEVPTGTDETIFDEVARGLGAQGSLVARMLRLEARLHADSADRDKKTLQAELDQLHHELDSETGWKLQHQIEQAIDRMSLDAAA